MANEMFPVNIVHDKAEAGGLQYLVIGGHAVNVYCEPRSTLDVDFLVRRDECKRWEELLKGEGFQPRSHGETFVLFNPPYGVRWRLDLMLVSEDTFGKILSAAKEVKMLGVTAQVPSIEHLLAMKVHALRHGNQERFEKDFGDVLNLIRNAEFGVDSEPVRRAFQQFGTEELYERVKQRLG